MNPVSQLTSHEVDALLRKRLAERKQAALGGLTRGQTETIRRQGEKIIRRNILAAAKRAGAIVKPF